MRQQYTLAMVKPGSFNEREEIQRLIKLNGFDILSLRETRFTPQQAATFYAEHHGKPFFEDLCAYMTRGKVAIMVLRHPDAIKKWRDLIGDTDPSRAKPGTIRYIFGKRKKLPDNVVHGSDSKDAAAREIQLLEPGIKTS